MDNQDLENLRNFETVWKRVKGGKTQPPKLPDIKLMPGKEAAGCALRYIPYNK